MGNCAGIDWASEKHDVLIEDPAGEELWAATFAHDENGVSALCAAFARFEVEVVAIERPDGLLVELLLEAGVQVLGLHPNQVRAPVGGFMYHHQPEEIAIQTSVFTRRGVERIVRFAFELARKRNKKRRVASITKSNAKGYSMVLWDRTFQQVALQYPDIETESLLADAAAINFPRRPHRLVVVVGSNLFADILSDLSAIIVGSMGLAASANLDPLRRFPSMFEPVHGSAPDIAGKNVVNPLATILSAGMMLDHLGMNEAAGAVESAVAAVLAEAKVRTPDLGGHNSTEEVANAVLEKLG